MARDLDQLADDLRNPKVVEALTKVLTAEAFRAEAFAKQNATGRPKVRTGRLRNSLKGRPFALGDRIGIKLSSNVIYAPTQEFGATIVPKAGQFLAVPLAAAKTGAGVTKAEFDVPGGLRQVPGLFVMRTGGKAFIVRQKGEGLEFLFVLKRSVRVPETAFMRRALQEVARDLPEKLASAAAEAISAEGAD